MRWRDETLSYSLGNNPRINSMPTMVRECPTMVRECGCRNEHLWIFLLKESNDRWIFPMKSTEEIKEYLKSMKDNIGKMDIQCNDDTNRILQVRFKACAEVAEWVLGDDL